MRKKCTAIVLSAGSGKRMNSNVAKQYLLLQGRPVIYYSIAAFEQSPLVDEIILVTGKGDIPYMQEEIVQKYGFQKVSAIVEGGAERFHSVQNALRVLKDEHADGTPEVTGGSYVLIHDGARPLVTEEIIRNTYAATVEYGACCAAMPVKDTIKVADACGFAVETPDRSTLYAVQTPQGFAVDVIKEAHGLLNERLSSPDGTDLMVTDDCMVVEEMLGKPVKLVEASYENIKITTPEDMEFAERLLEKRTKLT